MAHRRYFQLIRWDSPDELDALRRRYQQPAAERPDDAVSVYLAGWALNEHNTPESIRQLEKVKSIDPGFAWSYYSLSTPYGAGKFADKPKAAENIATHFRLCPDSLDSYAQWNLSRFGAPEAQAVVAKRVRERLAGEKDAKTLREGYEILWGLEFRVRPIPEHDKLRQQVAEDLKRLESVNARPDARWLVFLKGGYKQSGASEATLAALDDRLLRDFPDSSEALGILRERWRKEHPDPKAVRAASAREAVPAQPGARFTHRRQHQGHPQVAKLH